MSKITVLDIITGNFGTPERRQCLDKILWNLIIINFRDTILWHLIFIDFRNFFAFVCLPNYQNRTNVNALFMELSVNQ